MGYLNMVGLQGRLTKDAELIKKDGLSSICKFTLATNYARPREENGQKVWSEIPHFFYLKLFGKRAENLAPHLVKGQLVSLQGHLEQDQWESNGVRHSKMEFVVEHVFLNGVSKKKSNGTEKSDDEMGSESDGEIVYDETDDDFNIPSFNEGFDE